MVSKAELKQSKASGKRSLGRNLSRAMSSAAAIVTDPAIVAMSIGMLDAASKGDVAKVKEFIEKGVSPSCCDYDKRSGCMGKSRI